MEGTQGQTEGEVDYRCSVFSKLERYSKNDSHVNGETIDAYLLRFTILSDNNMYCHVQTAHVALHSTGR